MAKTVILSRHRLTINFHFERDDDKLLDMVETFLYRASSTVNEVGDHGGFDGDRAVGRGAHAELNR